MTQPRYSIRRYASLHRALSLFLTLAVAMPNSAFALRVMNTGMEESSVHEDLEKSFGIDQPGQPSFTAGMEEPTERDVKEAIRALKTEEGVGAAVSKIKWWSSAKPLPAALIHQVEDLVVALADNLYHSASFQEIFAILAEKESLLPALASHPGFIRTTVSNLTFEDWIPDASWEGESDYGIPVRSAAQDTLVALAKHQRFHSVLNAQVPELARQLNEVKPWVLGYVRSVLAAFAQMGIAPDAMDVAARRAIGTKRFVDFAKQGIGSDETLATAIAPSIVNLSHSSTQVRVLAQETLTALAGRGVATQSLADAVGPSIGNLTHPDPIVRIRAQETLTAFSSARVSLKSLVAAVEPSVFNLGNKWAGVCQAASQTLVALSAHRRFRSTLEAQVPAIITYLDDSKKSGDAQEAFRAFLQAGIVPEGVTVAIPHLFAELAERWFASDKIPAVETLRAIAKHERFHPALAAQLPALLELLSHKDRAVREAAQKALVVFIRYGVLETAFESGLLEEGSFRRLLSKAEAAPPQHFGLPRGVSWLEVRRFLSAWKQIRSLGSYQKLSLAAKASLRQELAQALKSYPTNPLERTSRLATHLVRREALDRALGFRSNGAELHLNTHGMDAGLLHEVRSLFITFHARMSLDIQPWIRESSTQDDLRLLPGMQSSFLYLLRLAADRLTDLLPGAWVGIHYSFGTNLRSELVPILLASFFGDARGYAWLPIPKGEAEVGMPGAYTYRGASVDPFTGNLLGKRLQTNLHLRPLGIWVRASPTTPERRWLDLFEEDLDHLNLLVIAAQAFLTPASRRSVQQERLAEIYRRFYNSWMAWVVDVVGTAGIKSIRAAEQAVAGKQGQGLSEELDKASAAIFQGLYGVDRETVATRGSYTREELTLAQPYLESLAEILQESYRQIEGTLYPDPVLKTYLKARSLEELEAAYPIAKEAVSRSLSRTVPGSSEQKQMSVLLEALTTAGLEEVERAHYMGSLIDPVQTRLALEKEMGRGRLRNKIGQIESDVLFTEWGVTYVPARLGKLIVIGDNHGDLVSLAKTLAQVGYDPTKNKTLPPDQQMYLVLLGDYTSGGSNNLEVVIKAFELKLRDPEHVVLLGGNHDRQRYLPDDQWVRETAPQWFFQELMRILGDKPGFALHDRWTELALELPVMAVFPNGIVAAHSAPPSLEDPPGELDPKFRTKFKRERGLLGMADPLIQEQVTINRVRDLADTRSDALITGGHRDYGSRYQPGYWVSHKSYFDFMESIGGRIFVRGHQTFAPPDEVLMAETFLTLQTFDSRSPDRRSAAVGEGVIARYAEFDLSRAYDKINPAEVVRYLPWEATGLEEATNRAESFLQTLAQESGPQGLTPVVIGTGLEERHPELAVLARFPELPVLRAKNRPPEELAVELVSRWYARSAVFAGLEDEATLYVPVFERARIATRVITPKSTAQAILSILAQATGLDEATLAAREGFGRFVADVSTLVRQL